MPTLASLGWGPRFADQLEPGDELLVPARVAVDHGHHLTVLSEDTEPFTVHAPRSDDRCVTGDWLLLGQRAGTSVVVRRLDRRTRLLRKSAGRADTAQLVAANLDVAFVVTSMNSDFNPNRLDRYVAALRGGGIEPVVVLSKADLDLTATRRFEARLPPDVAHVVTSAVLDLGIDALREWTGEGRTVGFVGSSGVGKSSLINGLLGENRLDTGEIRLRDERGQHTTTRRELVLLPGGGLLLDTPGMKELGLVEGDLDEAFADVDALAASCRFRDCEHEHEPGCAVVEAIEAGDLTPERLASWRKLARELARVEQRAWVTRRRQRRSGRLARDAQRERDRRRE